MSLLCIPTIQNHRHCIAAIKKNIGIASLSKFDHGSSLARILDSEFIIRLLVFILGGRWYKDDLSCKWWRSTADSAMCSGGEKLVTDLPNGLPPTSAIPVFLPPMHCIANQIAACSDFYNELKLDIFGVFCCGKYFIKHTWPSSSIALDNILYCCICVLTSISSYYERGSRLQKKLFVQGVINWKVFDQILLMLFFKAVAIQPFWFVSTPHSSSRPSFICVCLSEPRLNGLFQWIHTT